MKPISTAMQTLLSGKIVPALAAFWKITRQDGTVFGFTDWSDTTVVDGVTYRAGSGMTRSAMQERADLAVPGLEAMGFLNSNDITEEDIQGGRYDGAVVTSWLAVPTDANFATYGTIPLPGYYIGTITVKNGNYTAEIRGLSYALQQNFIELFSPTCLADFGDSRCTKDLTPLTDTGSVTAVLTPNKIISVELNSLNAGGLYYLGLITFTSGKSNGTSIEVSAWTGGTGATGEIALFIPSRLSIAVGDTFSIVPGCDKSFQPSSAGSYQGCYQWNNTDNFQGHPFIPGMQFLFDYGVATQ